MRYPFPTPIPTLTESDVLNLSRNAEGIPKAEIDYEKCQFITQRAVHVRVWARIVAKRR